MFGIFADVVKIVASPVNAKRLRNNKNLVRPYYAKPTKDIVLNNVRNALLSNNRMVT